MPDKHRKALISTSDVYEAVIVDAAVDTGVLAHVDVRRICWNTGEEKNCSSCYLSSGCKAKA